MAKFQPTSVSHVCEEVHEFLVLPAIGQELPRAQLTETDRNLCRVFIMRVERAQLGRYQQAVSGPDEAAPPGTLYLELDKPQFKKASELLLHAREEQLPAIEWKLDAGDFVASLAIGSTPFQSTRRSDIQEILEGDESEADVRVSGGSATS